jgi:uncharacterized protein (DUF305 family)
MKKYASPLAILITLAAVASSAAELQNSHTHGANAATSKDWSELTASMGKMHSAMGSIKPSGDSDVDFVRLMLPHHRAAIDMAKTQLMYGKDPQIRRLAQEIIADQQSEIELMRLWLKQHGSSSEVGSQTPDAGVGKDH